MLEHVMDGQVESAVVCHRRSGARAVITATVEHGGDMAPVSVATALDDGYTLGDDGDWKYVMFRDGHSFRFRVVHLPQRRMTGMPTFCIDAARWAFQIDFVVLRSHPDHPARAHTAREFRRV
jgi:hypothetical protein